MLDAERTVRVYSQARVVMEKFQESPRELARPGEAGSMDEAMEVLKGGADTGV